MATVRVMALCLVAALRPRLDILYLAAVFVQVAKLLGGHGPPPRLK